MTPQQLTTLKAAILAETDAGFVALRTANNEQGMADWYNGASGFVAWKKRVNSDEIGPALNYIAVAALTTANRDRATTFLNLNRASFVPSADIETYWADTFGGALGGQGQATRDALVALWRRIATRGERLFCMGTGTTIAPGTLGDFEGNITAQNISDALRA